MKHLFSWALEQLEFSPAQNLVLLAQKPVRWDEYLELDAPLLIHSRCQDWKTLGPDLWRSGLSPKANIQLLTPNQERSAIPITELGLGPAPEATDWVLVLNRTAQTLQGRHYVVTRAADQGSELMSRLGAHGAEVRHIPCLEFVEPDSPEIIEEALKKSDDYHLIVFTSKNAVRFFLAYLNDQNVKATLACIGPGTAQSLTKAGMTPDLVAEDSVAEGLLQTLRQHYGPKIRELNILLPRAQVAREILPEKLRELGARVTVAPVYKTIAPPTPMGREPLHPNSRVIFSSASTVKNWNKVVGDSKPPCYCIGPVTALAAEAAGFEVLATAKEFTLDGLVNSILSHA